VNAVDYQADSTDPTGQTSRRTYDTFSTDGGMTWEVPVEVPTIRSGFCVLKLKSTGEAVITNHNEAGGYLNANLYVELAPQVGVFTEYLNNEPRDIWPQISVLSNGNIAILGRPNNAGVNTDLDTLFFNTFNGTTFSPKQVIRVARPPYLASVGSNERHNMATNGNGEITVVSAPVLEDDTLSNSRVYYRTSTDNGATWGPEGIVFAPYTINNSMDTVSTAGGSDLVYKPGTSKWYYAYPITVDNLFANGKLVITKSNGITDTITTAADVGATSTYLTGMAFVFNIDFPALGWSQDNSVLYCVYSVVTPDTSRGYNSRDLYYQWSTDEGTTWSTPFRITNTPDIDETYPSVSFWNPGITGSVQHVLNFTYMKDPGVGPTSFNGNYPSAPESRNYLIFRQINDAGPIGIKNKGTVAYEYKLLQNYPNPFNPSTRIVFNLAKNSFVTLKVYDILGREVKTLVNGLQNSGAHDVQLNASDLSSGVYFYTIRATDQSSGNTFTDTKKMMLLK
jgi:hypothetical protein